MFSTHCGYIFHSIQNGISQQLETSPREISTSLCRTLDLSPQEYFRKYIRSTHYFLGRTTGVLLAFLSRFAPKKTMSLHIPQCTLSNSGVNLVFASHSTTSLQYFKLNF